MDALMWFVGGVVCTMFVGWVLSIIMAARPAVGPEKKGNFPACTCPWGAQTHRVVRWNPHGRTEVATTHLMGCPFGEMMARPLRSPITPEQIAQKIVANEPLMAEVRQALVDEAAGKGVTREQMKKEAS